MSTEQQKAMIHEIIENSMRQGGRYVTVFFGRDAVNLSVYPLKDNGEDTGGTSGGALVEVSV